MLNKRQQSILAFITENGEAKNSQLQALIGDCSSMTLWRDLEKLEQEGKIVRFRGGAQAAPEQEDGQGQETNFVRRARLNTGEKESIALIAADLLQPDQSYFLAEIKRDCLDSICFPRFTLASVSFTVCFFRRDFSFSCSYQTSSCCFPAYLDSQSTSPHRIISLLAGSSTRIAPMSLGS